MKNKTDMNENVRDMLFDKFGNTVNIDSDMLCEFLDFSIREANVKRSIVTTCENLIGSFLKSIGFNFSNFIIDPESVRNFLDTELDPLEDNAKIDGLTYRMLDEKGRTYVVYTKVSTSLKDNKVEGIDPKRNDIFLKLGVKCSIEYAFVCIDEKGNTFQYNHKYKKFDPIPKNKDESYIDKLLKDDSIEGEFARNLYYEIDNFTDSEFEKYLSENLLLAELLYKTRSFMEMRAYYEGNDDKLSFIITPRDPMRSGCGVIVKNNIYYLCQYITGDDLIDDDLNCLSEDFDDFCYIRTIAKTSDLNIIIKLLDKMCNRYTDDPVYTVPLSGRCFADFKTIGKMPFNIFYEMGNEELDDHEKKNLTAFSNCLIK